MYTGTNLCCCPSNMVFAEVFVGKYWLKHYIYVWRAGNTLLSNRKVCMTELEAAWRSILNPKYCCLCFFRRIVAPGWCGWGNSEVNLQLRLAIKSSSYTSAVMVSVFSNCWALCVEKVIWRETLRFLADYILLSVLSWSKALGNSWVSIF